MYEHYCFWCQIKDANACCNPIRNWKLNMTDFRLILLDHTTNKEITAYFAILPDIGLDLKKKRKKKVLFICFIFYWCYQSEINTQKLIVYTESSNLNTFWGKFYIFPQNLETSWFFINISIETTFLSSILSFYLFTWCYQSEINTRKLIVYPNQAIGPKKFYF